MGLSASKPTQEEMSAVASKVEEIIANNKVAMFSKSYCRKCLRLTVIIKA